MLPPRYRWRECPEQPGRWELMDGGRICAIVSTSERGAHVTLGTDGNWTSPLKRGSARSLELARKHAEWWAAWRERKKHPGAGAVVPVTRAAVAAGERESSQPSPR